MREIDKIGERLLKPTSQSDGLPPILLCKARSTSPITEDDKAIISPPTARSSIV